MPTVKGEFENSSWDENNWLELEDGRKLSRANVTQNFDGGLSGKASIEWLMSYQPDGTARVVGFARFEGSLEKHEGSFTIETIADFDGQEATGTWSVVPDSAAGQLSGLRGEGRFQAPLGPKGTYNFDYVIK